MNDYVKAPIFHLKMEESPVMKEVIKTVYKRLSNRNALVIIVATIMIATAFVPLLEYNHPVSPGTNGASTPNISVSRYDPYMNITGSIDSASGSLPNQWTGQTIGSPYGFMTVGGNGFALYNTTTNTTYSDYINGYSMGAAFHNNYFVIAGSNWGPGGGAQLYIYYPQNNTASDVTGKLLNTDPGLGQYSDISKASYYNGTFYLLGNYALQSNGGFGNYTKTLFYSYNPVTGSFTNLSSLFGTSVLNDIESLSTPDGLFILGISPYTGRMQFFQYNTNTFLTNRTSSLPPGFGYSGINSGYNLGAIYSPSSNMALYNGTLLLAGETTAQSGTFSYRNLTLVSLNPANGALLGKQFLPGSPQGFISSVSTDSSSVFLSGMNAAPGTIGTPVLYHVTGLTATSGNFNVSSYLLHVHIPSNFIAYGKYAFETGGSSMGNVYFGLVTLTPEASLSIFEYGLPADTLWWATVNGTVKSTFGNSLTFNVVPAGYTVTGGSVLTYYTSSPAYVDVTGYNYTSTSLVFSKTQSSSSELVQTALGPFPGLDMFHDSVYGPQSNVYSNTLQTLVAMNGNGTSYYPELAAFLPTVSNGGINSNSYSYSLKAPWGATVTQNVTPYENYTFYMSQSALWQNGSSVTAFDVAYTIGAQMMVYSQNPSTTMGWLFSSYLLPNGGYGTASFFNISRAISFDSYYHSITFHFVQPMSPDLAYSIFSSFYAFIIDPSWIYSLAGLSNVSAAWSSYGLKVFQLTRVETAMQNSLFSDGPYELAKYLPANGAVMKANPYFKSPGAWDPAPSVNNTAIMYVPESNVSIAQMNAGVAQITNNAGKTPVGNTYRIGGRTQEEYGLAFNSNISLSALSSVFSGANVPYNMFSNLDARRAFIDAFNYSAIAAVNASSSFSSYVSQYAGVIPYNLLNSSEISALSVYSKQNLTAARNEWSAFALSSQATANNIVYNGTDYTYNGKPFVIPVFLYQGDVTDQYLVQQWNRTVSSLFPGVSLVSIFTYPWGSFSPGTDGGAIFFAGWAPDYNNYVDYLGPFLESYNTWTSISDIMPQYIGSTSNSFSDPQQANQLNNLNNLVNEADTTGNQTLANLYADQANQLGARLGMMVQTFVNDYYWTLSNNLSSAEMQNELNPYIISENTFLFAFASYNAPPKTYDVNITFTGMYSNYGNLSAAGGDPTYTIGIAGQYYSILPSNGGSNYSNTLSLSLTNGTYPYHYFWFNPSTGLNGTLSGTLTVNGSSVSLSLNFSRNSAGQYLYPVRLMSSSLLVDDSFYTSMTYVLDYAGTYTLLLLTNGTYSVLADTVNNPYTYYYNFTVAGGAVNLVKDFSASPSGSSLYPVMFNNQNVPTGTITYVSYASSSVSGSGQITPGETVYLYLPNGTYSYVNALNYTFSENVSGTFTIAGKAITVSDSFAQYYKYNVTFTPAAVALSTVSVTINNQTYTGYGDARVQLNPGTYDAKITLPSGYSTFSNIHFTLGDSPMNEIFPVFLNTSGISPLAQFTGAGRSIYVFNSSTAPEFVSGGQIIVVASVESTGVLNLSSSGMGIYFNSVFHSFNTSALNYSLDYAAGIFTEFENPGIYSINVPYALSGNIDLSVYEVPSGYGVNYSNDLGGLGQYYPQYQMPLGYQYYLFTAMGSNPRGNNGMSFGQGLNLAPGYSGTDGYTTSYILNFNGTYLPPVSDYLSAAISTKKVKDYNLKLNLSEDYTPLEWTLNVSSLTPGMAGYFFMTGTSKLISLYGYEGNISYTLNVTGAAATPGSGIVNVTGQTVINVSVSVYNTTVAIHEVGLSPGTAWSVTAGASTYFSSGAYLNLSLKPSRYVVFNFSANGYEAMPGLVEANVTVYGTSFQVYFENSSVFSIGHITKTLIPSTGTSYTGMLLNTTLIGDNVLVPFAADPSGEIVYIMGYNSNVNEYSLTFLAVNLTDNAVTDLGTFATVSYGGLLDMKFDSFDNSLYLLYGYGYLGYLYSFNLNTGVFSDVYNANFPVWIDISLGSSISFAGATYNDAIYFTLGDYLLSVLPESGYSLAFSTNLSGTSNLMLTGMAFDPVINTVVAVETGPGTNELMQVSATTGAILSIETSAFGGETLTYTGSPQSMDYLQHYREIAVELETSNGAIMYMVNASTLAVSSSQTFGGGLPVLYALTYNPGNGLYYAGFINGYNWMVTEFNSAESVTYPVIPAFIYPTVYSSFTQSIIAGSPYGGIYYLSTSSTKATYSLDFTESGLAPGTQWGVTVSGQGYMTTGSSIVLSVPNGVYQYQILVSNTYIATPSAGSTTVNGNNVTVSVKFSRVVYTVTISENGLPTGASWSVNVSGMNTYSAGAGTPITVSLWNGTYTLYPGTTDSDYTAGTVSFTVSGSPVNVAVHFSLILYTVTVYESGLPANEEWFVNTTAGGSYSSYGSSLSFQAPNGNYMLTVSTIATSYKTEYANVTVSGAPVSLTVFFTQILPGTLKLHASPPFATVTVNSYPVGLNSNGNATLNLTQGTYYINASASGYSSYSTVIQITSGSLYYLNITLSPRYEIVFQQSNLPSGSTWYVELTGTGYSSNLSSTSSYIIFNNLQSGTYSYAVMEYLYVAQNTRYVDITNQTGTVSVASQNAGVSVYYGKQFYLNTSVSPASGGSVSPPAGWYNANSTVTLSVTPFGHYGLLQWVGTGLGSYSGFSNNVNIVILGPITEVAEMQNAYLATFSESGLPAGMEWYLNLSNGMRLNTTGTSISLYLMNGSYGYTVSTPGYLYNAPGGTLSISGSANSASIVFTEQTYNVTFTESGLPTGTLWYVNITGQNPLSSTSGTITVQLDNGTYTFTVSSVNSRYETASSGSFTVNGAGFARTVTFAPVLYTVTFTESTLPAGTTWYVNITGLPYLSSTSGTITARLQNGTYSYTISTLDKKYEASPRTGSLTVSGSASSVSVTFKAVTYKVTFTESNLPAGTEWYLNFTGGASHHTTGTSISVSLQNGTYSYTLSTNGYIYHSPGSTVTVTGASFSVAVPFTEQVYTVTFTESGLPTGTLWYVNMSTGQNIASVSASVTVQLSNGTYGYRIATTDKLYSAPGSSFTISGSARTFAVAFHPVNYTVTITESGLPSGIYWYFNITGKNPVLAGKATFSVQLDNGTYSYTAQSTDKSFSSLSGTLTVDGSNLYIGIFFTSMSPGTIKFSLDPAFAQLTVNGYVVQTTSGSISMSLQPGTYYVNVSFAGYRPDSVVLQLKSGEILYENITLTAVTSYGYLIGTVNPAYSTIVASGVDIPVINGSFNQTLAVGTYYVDISATGYGSQVIVVNITKGTASTITVTLKATPKSYTISGYVLPDNASVTMDGYIAYVSANGFYKISLPNGTYDLSVYADGYYPYSKSINLSGNILLNITLKLEPKATSSNTTSNVTVSGYNVTISSVNVSSAQISVNYTGTAGGELIVALPFAEVKNETINQLLSSTVYINGIAQSNYTITISSDYTVILTVFNLTGDPTLTWAVSGNAAVTHDYRVKFNGTGLPTGTQWFVNLSNGESLTTNGNSVEVGLANGTYTFTVTSLSKNYTLIKDITSGSSAYNTLTGTIHVSGNSEYITFSFTRSYFTLDIKETGLPPGTIWTANVNGIQVTGSTSTIQLTVKIGQYTVTADNTTYYYSDTFAKSVTVSDSNVTVSVAYTHFAHLNLKLSPANATVTLNGKVIAHTGSVMNITLPAGQYYLKVSENGYLSYYKNFSLSQNGNENLNITLQVQNQPSVTSPNPLAGGYTVYIIAGAVVVILALVAVAMIRRKK